MRSIEIRRVKRLAELSIIATFALAPAFATTINYTGAEQTFTVTTTGEYQIVAYGAQGGAAGLNYYGATPGLGAEIGGNFELTAGEYLTFMSEAPGRVVTKAEVAAAVPSLSCPAVRHRS